MNAEIPFLSLLIAALSVGALHALAPDHWLPFAAVARARGWSSGRTARVTFACGLGHLGASLLLALGGLWLSTETLTAFGSRLTSLAGLLLICGGLTYGAWSWHRTMAHRLDAEVQRDASRLTAGGLFVLFCLDPCVALIPLLFAAASLGAAQAVAVGLAYAAATLGTMLTLSLAARRGLEGWRAAFVDRWGDVLAGGTVAAAGMMVALLGW